MKRRALVTLPFAGAHRDVFADLSRKFLELEPGSVTLNHAYPGHGRRFREGLLPTVERMADDCVESIVERFGGEPVEVLLLGYSMGAIVAFEVCARLEAQNIHVTHCAFMASTPPPDIQHIHLDVRSDDALLKHCEQYGLIDPGTFDSPQMRELFLPSLRNDIVSVNEYARSYRSHTTLSPGVRCAVFTGESDLTVSKPANWDRVLSTGSEQYFYDGGHFFFFDWPDEVLADLLGFLQSATPLKRKENRDHSGAISHTRS